MCPSIKSLNAECWLMMEWDWHRHTNFIYHWVILCAGNSSTSKLFIGNFVEIWIYLNHVVKLCVSKRILLLFFHLYVVQFDADTATAIAVSTISFFAHTHTLLNPIFNFKWVGIVIQTQKATSKKFLNFKSSYMKMNYIPFNKMDSAKTWWNFYVCLFGLVFFY